MFYFVPGLVTVEEKCEITGYFRKQERILHELAEEGGKGRNEEQTDVPRADVMKRDGRQRPSVSHCPQLHSPPSTFRSGWATHTHTHTHP